ncbi:hypothetical protein OHU45_37215 [Streptomyces tubercidicus]|uniref:hypothetical protein n=1 Tax=Streptomyces tubercidicus TaxID=47759 RepID=UPI0030E10337
MKAPSGAWQLPVGATARRHETVFGAQQHTHSCSPPPASGLHTRRVHGGLFLPQAVAGSLAPAAPLDARAQGARGVAAVTYNLGDQAYRLPGTKERVEIAATVHYPKISAPRRGH